MQAKRRFILLAGIFTIFALCLCVSLLLRDDSDSDHDDPTTSAGESLRTYLDVAYKFDLLDHDIHLSPRKRRHVHKESFNNSLCRMDTCFNISMCRNGFKVYIYPPEPDVPISSKYREIIESVKRSRYYTRNAADACLFVLSYDTLDRDKLSTDFVHDLPSKLSTLPHWNGGQNHIVFNLYPGTWPDYDETDLGFDTGKAILAKASFSQNLYRPNFDISFPLFDKHHSPVGGEPGYLLGNFVPPVRNYTLVFKGKRYLTGKGSETRNSLYHIDNNKDIILLTTCKHGKGWKKKADERCKEDNANYDRYDYKVMLHNSTFCLVPRGRRLGSYRFLEVLQAACIPVSLSNNWVLPFSEVIDWNRAAVLGDERLLLQVPSTVRSMSHADILLMRQHTQFLWDSYFSSIDKIVSTTLEIIKERVAPHLARTSYMWNTPPGGLLVSPEYSTNLAQFPFYWRHLSVSPGDRFTAVIYATSSSVMSSSPLYRLVKNIGKSQNVDKVLVLWHSSAPVPTDVTWPVTSRVHVIIKPIHSIDERFHVFPEITTNAVLSLDDDATIVTDEMDFGFSVWQHFAERIVGFPARDHVWDEAVDSWTYSSKWSNQYSMVLTGAAFYHRYYGYLYETILHSSLHHLVDSLQNCEDILLNMLVAHTIKQPPIKVGQRHFYKETLVAGSDRTVRWNNPDHFRQRHYCLAEFAEQFGYMPLKRSEVRFDPHLYKDPVSILRKKYRQMETIS